MTDIVVPAGGVIEGAFAAQIGSPYRALAPLGPNRTPLLAHVLDTLRAAVPDARIICVAPEVVAKIVAGADLWLPVGGSGPENMRLGLRHADPSQPTLLCASDLPLLTVSAVRDFADACRADADLTVGLVHAESYLSAFPDAPPSEFTTLTETGPITLAGLFGVRPDLLTRRAALFDTLFAARKSPWRLARIVGPKIAWQLATRTLTLSTLTERAEHLLGGSVQIIDNADPALAYDTDTLDDYTYAETRFGA